MSAYIVDRNHILYMVSAAMSHTITTHGPFRWFTADGIRGELGSTDYRRAVEVANMLWNENVKSVRYRYSDHAENDLPGPIGEDYKITLRDFNGACFDSFKPVQVLKSCDCYVYQSCEHEAWPKSEARAFIESLRGGAWRALPGYDLAEWGAPEPMKGAVNLSVMMSR